MENMLCVYCIYDPDGVADEYIFHQLDSLLPHVAHFAIVCNGQMEPRYLERLRNYTPDVFVRENTGYDGTAYRDTLLDFLGMERVLRFDSLLLMNDTCYGPLFPLSAVFREMDGRDLDFWGITAQAEVEVVSRTAGKSHVARHIQGYFLVANHRLLHSGDFRLFWEQLPPITTHEDAVLHFEMGFTDQFAARGYRWGTYVDALHFCTEDHVSTFPNFIYHDFDVLVQGGKSPFVKKRHFAFNLSDIFFYSYGENPRKTLEYIRRHTAYDENLILNNLIRCGNLADLYRTLHLDYILPSRAANAPNALAGKQVLAAVYISRPELVSHLMEYLRGLPAGVDLWAIPATAALGAELEHRFQQHGISGRITPPANSPWRALLECCGGAAARYDLFCFAPDTDGAPEEAAAYPVYPHVSRSLANMVFENTLKSGAFVENVAACFAENPKLGFLGVPRPYFGHYYKDYVDAWAGHYGAVEQLAGQLGLQCRLTPDKQPVSVLPAFWCRPAALAAIFAHRFAAGALADENVQAALARLLPYAAQHAGYYSGVVMSDGDAALQAVNLEYMATSPLCAPQGHFYAQTRFANEFEILQFCRRYPKIYIYGAGACARHSFRFAMAEMQTFLGFVVSDGRGGQEKPYGCPVWELSNVLPGADVGMLVGMNWLNQLEAAPLLREKGFENLLFVRE